MQIIDVIQHLEEQGTWVNRAYQTRDHILFGDSHQEIERVGVCWVATKQVIQEAIKKIFILLLHMKIHFINALQE